MSKPKLELITDETQVAVDPNTLSDAELLKRYECYGHAFVVDDEMCMEDCAVRDRCIVIIGKQTIPSIIKQSGMSPKDVSPSDVAMELGSDEKSVKLCATIAQKPAKLLELLPPAMSPLGTPPGAPAAEEVVEDDTEEAPEEEPEPPPPPPKKKASPPKKKAPPAKKKKKKAPAKKKKVKKPRAAPTAKLGKGGAPLTEAELRKIAYDRERARSPLVAELKPNQVLKRVYKGEEVKVRVRKDGYEWDGQIYGTLYAVVMAITGPREYLRQEFGGVRRDGTRTMSNWSAPKFFRLAEL